MLVSKYRTEVSYTYLVDFLSSLPGEVSARNCGMKHSSTFVSSLRIRLFPLLYVRIDGWDIFARLEVISISIDPQQALFRHSVCYVSPREVSGIAEG